LPKRRMAAGLMPYMETDTSRPGTLKALSCCRNLSARRDDAGFAFCHAPSLF
jgi:hypothetical protein